MIEGDGDFLIFSLCINWKFRCWKISRIRIVRRRCDENLCELGSRSLGFQGITGIKYSFVTKWWNKKNWVRRNSLLYSGVGSTGSYSMNFETAICLLMCLLIGPKDWPCDEVRWYWTWSNRKTDRWCTDVLVSRYRAQYREGSTAWKLG